MARSSLALTSFASLRVAAGLDVFGPIQRIQHTERCVICRSRNPHTVSAVVLFALVNGGPTGSLSGPVCKGRHEAGQAFRTDDTGRAVSRVQAIQPQTPAVPVEASQPALSASQGAVLLALQIADRVNKGRGLTAKELVTVTGLSVSTVRLQASKLKALGLVNVSKQGRSNLYTVAS